MKYLLNFHVFFYFLVFLVFPNISFSQTSHSLRVAFYNVENLFDAEHDSAKYDTDYLEGGNHNWNNWKLYQKLNGISKIYYAMGQWDGIAAMGLCEVENKNVIYRLLHHTPLKKMPLKAIQYASPDKRGIENVFLYDTNRIQIIFSKPIHIRFPFDTASRTRDILYVKTKVASDTIHFFVNHWPSRFGGYMNTVPKRKFVGARLREEVDSILILNELANIIIMGDLNDEEDRESITLALGAAKVEDTIGKKYPLINLMATPEFTAKGTHKYQGLWGKLDHIIVSKAVYDNRAGIRLVEKKANVFKAPFLIEKDEKFLGEKPFRTYIGFSYHGGYSDHFPVYIDLIIR